MGRGGPLDHPELLEMQKLLDDRNVSEAQKLLGRLGNRAELSYGIVFLTMWLFYVRGWLDFCGVVDWFRELFAVVFGFEEVFAFLAEVETTTSIHPGAPPSQRKGLPATPVVPKDR